MFGLDAWVIDALGDLLDSRWWAAWVWLAVKWIAVFLTVVVVAGGVAGSKREGVTVRRGLCVGFGMGCAGVVVHLVLQLAWLWTYELWGWPPFGWPPVSWRNVFWLAAMALTAWLALRVLRPRP